MIAAAMIASAIMAQANHAKAKFDFAKESPIINSDLATNANQLMVIDSLVNDFSKVPIDDRYLTIYSEVSPDETAGDQNQLAIERAKSVHRIFDDKLRGMSQCDAHAIYREKVNNWHDVLKAIKAKASVPDKEILISTLENLLNKGNTSNEEIIREVKVVGDGSAYQYLCNQLFPTMRKAVIVLCYLNLPKPQPEPKKVVAEQPIPNQNSAINGDEALQPEIPINKESLEFSNNSQRLTNPLRDWSNISSNFALKTNLLYDLALTPNIGIEWSISKNLSVSADWMYAWWSHDPTHYYWRIYGGNLELEYWFGNKQERKFTGHHLGVYGGIVTYDFEFGGRGYLGDKWSYMAGLSYGYSLPIASRFNLDFEIGIGYIGGDYYEYDFNDDAKQYFWRQTKKRKWLGPTKAEVSLVWLLGK